MEEIEKVKVLVVDNEKTFASTLTSHLQFNDIAVRWAGSGEEALASLRKFRPDVLLLDLCMGRVGGLEVLRQMKTRYPEIEVIVLTGTGSFDAAITCMQLGAFDYLRKPVDLNQLMEVITSAYTHRSGKKKD